MNLSYLLIVFAAITWGSIGIAGEVLFNHGFEPQDLIWFRCAVCFIAIFLICLIFNRSRMFINRRDWPIFVLYGLFSVAFFYYSYFNAIDQTGVAVAAVLLYTSPAMVVILSRFLFKESIGTIKVLCVFLTILGCVLVVKAYDVNNLKLNQTGIVMGLLAGFFYSTYTLFGKKTSTDYHAWTVILYSQGFGLLFLSLLHFPAAVFFRGYDAGVWFTILYIGLVPTLFANFCFNTALKNTEPGRASIVATIEPVAAAILAYFVFGQVLETVQILGASLIILAALVVQLPAANKKHLQEENE
ncbi:DMT family transporter [Desulfotruncus alcoholivorax]|uniref:DMT family transporter n=1 Tax=Desulfotruncus alcoholivorax TaxID=265477 RepID=UPI000423B139|nr:EamA family transporter [Desulfotruncus alcoholivorax]